MVAHPCARVNLAQAVLIALILLYRYTLGFVLGGRCRFYPSCSSYALDAVFHHGAARGSVLAVRRVARCHPWNPGGVDPVPEHGVERSL
jgi:uncharacterized protein